MNDAMFYTAGFWWFYDETWNDSIGPYDDLETCKKAFEEYGEYLINPDGFKGITIPYSKIKKLPSDEEINFELMYELRHERMPTIIDRVGHEYEEDDNMKKFLVHEWLKKKDEIIKMLYDNRCDS